jgi:hypothetical protein
MNITADITPVSPEARGEASEDEHAALRPAVCCLLSRITQLETDVRELRTLSDCTRPERCVGG